MLTPLPPWMQWGSTALICAANYGQLETAQELLKRGANKEAKDDVMQGAV